MATRAQETAKLGFQDQGHFLKSTPVDATAKKPSSLERMATLIRSNFENFKPKEKNGGLSNA